ncbi:MAG: lipase maturation factor family protein [Myxococcales bacterium]|nr:lipase maturation factor family protein [Myxococcales bacterium]
MVHKPEATGQHLPRLLFLRLLALTHVAAFASFWVQAHGLVGEQGVAPAVDRVARAKAMGLGFLDLPGLHWLSAGDGMISVISAGGLLAAVALFVGVAPRIMLGVLWLLYLSVFHMGGPFLSFQWDLLLIEASLLAIPYAPAGLRPRFRTAEPPSAWATWLLRLLLFKLMFSSGVVKLNNADPTWHGLTALSYHYWTQPIPHGVAWYAHQLPAWVHAFSTAATLVIELVAPILILVNPRRWRLAVFVALTVLLAVLQGGVFGPWTVAGLALAATLLDDRVLGRVAPGLVPDPAPGGGARWAAFVSIVGLMGAISLTGNYGFFQLLTVALCLPLLDDEAFWALTPARLIPKWPAFRVLQPGWVGRGLAVILTLAFTVLSALTMISLVGGQALGEAVNAEKGGQASTGQALLAKAWDLRRDALAHTRSFASINGYGLFARMTTQRFELQVEGTADGQTWKTYRFVYKPDAADEAPPLVGVHMPRLDWNMWFAALEPRCPTSGWLPQLVRGLLEGRAPVRDLLAEDPFGDTPPQAIRIRRAHYKFTDGDTRDRTGDVWAVQPVDELCAPMTLKDFKPRR